MGECEYEYIAVPLVAVVPVAVVAAVVVPILK